MDAVNAPFGTLIAKLDGGNLELRWQIGHVYCFAKQYQNDNFTGKWEVENFGTKQEAQREYPLIREKFDAVCK
jgi:hypothetical protein